MNCNPTTPDYYLCRFDGIRTELSAYWTGSGWQYREPNGTTYDIAPPLSWREFPEWNRDVPEVDYIENSKRFPRLQELYRKSGRDRPKDPMRGLFTGLFQEAGF